MKRLLLAAGMTTILGLTGVQTANAAICGLACSNVNTPRTGHTLTKATPAPAPKAQTNVKTTRTGHIKHKPVIVKVQRTGHNPGTIRFI